MAIQVAERERLLLKEKAELVDIVLNYQHTDNNGMNCVELLCLSLMLCAQLMKRS